MVVGSNIGNTIIRSSIFLCRCMCIHKRERVYSRYMYVYVLVGECLHVRIDIWVNEYVYVEGSM